MLCAYQPTTRPVALSVELAADDGTKRRDRTKKTWHDIMNEDLKEIGLDWTGLERRKVRCRKSHQVEDSRRPIF